MLKSYFLIAFRHFTRHKVFTLINIICLSIGITFSLLTGDYIFKEKSVNAWLKDIDNQYVIKSKWKQKDMGLEVTTIAPLLKALKDQYPSMVQNYYRFDPVTNVVTAGEKHFREDIAIGDTTLISMYGFKVLYGNQHQAFADDHSAVITDAMAKKLFGKEDAVNEVLTIDQAAGGKSDYKITAVLKAPPYNSVTNFIKGDAYQIFVPNKGNNYYQGGDPLQFWNNANTVGLVELNKGVTPQALQKPVKQLLALNAPAAITQNLEVELVPLKQYYLSDNMNNGVAGKMITTLSLIALFILLMAIINFVNINIGTSTYRLKEIGLRKVFWQ